MIRRGGWQVIIWTLFIIGLSAAVLFSSLKNVPAHERGVVYRLGKPMRGTVGPGLVLMMPIVDRMIKISVAAETIEVGRATVVYRVVDPFLASTETSDYKASLITLARELVESESGTDSAEMAKRVRSQLEDAVRPWGIQIQTVNANRFAK